jgi:hypothetical protein
VEISAMVTSCTGHVGGAIDHRRGPDREGLDRPTG